jgi:hypothetical protein
VLGRLGAPDVAPVAAVGGNHDLRLDDFGDRARAHGIRLLHEEPLELGRVSVEGVEVRRGDVPPRYVGERRSAPAGGELRVLASHFPVLSEATRVAAAGLPYAGDLVNRPELEAALRAAPPTVVLCGHIHARCSRADGAVLQLMVGAMIEPPFDATIVEIDGTSVRRTARRLGDVPVTDPVFSADEERWQLLDDRWAAELPVAAG